MAEALAKAYDDALVAGAGHDHIGKTERGGIACYPRVGHEERRRPELCRARLAHHCRQIPEADAARRDERVERALRPGFVQRRRAERRHYAPVTFRIHHLRTARGERFAEQFAATLTAKNHDTLAGDLLKTGQRQQRLAVETVGRRDHFPHAATLQGAHGRIAYRRDREAFGQTALRTPAEGIADLAEIKQLGLRGVMLPGMPGEKDYDDPMWDPFWEAALALGLPLSFHILTTPSEFTRARGPALNYAVAIIRANQDIIGMLIYGGVFERHPKLRIVCVEADAGWAPHWMYRMDHYYTRHHHLRQRGLERHRARQLPHHHARGQHAIQR